VVRRLEWWPDNEGGPLWDEGKSVPLDDLGLTPDLVQRLVAWSSSYTDDRLPVDGPGDVIWLEEGANLLKELRVALGERVRVVVTEPWWGIPEEDFQQPGGGH
jgi:hypothetical protein